MKSLEEVKEGILSIADGAFRDCIKLEKTAISVQDKILDFVLTTKPLYE